MDACEVIPCKLCPHLVKSKDGRYFCGITRKEIIEQDMPTIQEI